MYALAHVQGGPLPNENRTFWDTMFFLQMRTDFQNLCSCVHQVIRKKILYVRLKKISTSPAICCYTTVWKSKIQINVTINMFN